MYESNDTFYEEVVERVGYSVPKTRRTTYLIVFAIFLVFTLGSLITAPAIILLAMFLFTLLTLVMFIVSFMKRELQFEYSYTNGSVDVAKIFENEKRKHLLTFEAQDINVLAKEGTNEALKFDNVSMKTYDCSSHDSEAKTYVMVCHNQKTNQNYKVIWNPSEKMVDDLKRLNSTNVYK